MARFDELDRPGRSPAIPDRPSYRSAPGPARALAAPAGPAEPLLAMIRLGLLALLLACWVAGAYAGIVFWSVVLKQARVGAFKLAVLGRARRRR